MTASTSAFARLEALLERPVGIVTNGPEGLPCGVQYARVPYASSVRTREEFCNYLNEWAVAALIA